MELKGTVLVLITMIIQIIINAIVLITLPAFGMIMLIDTLIIASYFGFKNGKRGWAIFATVYGIISMGLAFSQGNFINISILLLIAGILALSDK